MDFADPPTVASAPTTTRPMPVAEAAAAPVASAMAPPPVAVVYVVMPGPAASRPLLATCFAPLLMAESGPFFGCVLFGQRDLTFLMVILRVKPCGTASARTRESGASCL